MKIEEAIRRIKVHNEIHSRKEHNAILITEALNMAVEALEKQIPKKPVEETINYDYGTKSQRCPSCGNPLRHYRKPHDSYDEDFCRKCGQALDWGNQE